jgi:hypothetical protein
LTYVHNTTNNNKKKRCKNNKSLNFVWGLNNNKKRCKKNKSPNFVWGLNKKQSKHNMSPETSFGGHNKKRSKHNKTWYYMAPKRWISIRYIIIYLEIKFRPNRKIFVFWRPFLVQNGHHSKPKWSPYGAVCLIPCKYSFPLKSVNFWIFNDFFNFYIGGHFEMAAILKILITKSTTLSDDLFLCQDSKGSAVRFEFNIFCTLVTMATVAILIFFSTPQKLPHTTVDILTKFHEVWWKESIFFIPPFLFLWQLWQSLSNRFRFFLGLSRSIRCGCCS